MRRAKVMIAPEIVLEHLFGRASYAITSATIENVSIDPATGAVVFQLLGPSVPNGKCMAVFKTMEAAGGAKVAVLQGLLATDLRTP